MDQSALASQLDLVAGETEQGGDPFLSASASSNHHRFSHFDNQLFALGPTTSPDQAKQALEAHLAETERRMQEASRLGTTLLQQRKDLADRLKDVERQQTDGDITPELRQKLVDIEKEYNEVGRESARAFLPKSRVSSSEMAGSPFVGEMKRSASPSKFESQATNSPSKLSVPNRKQRNQPSNRDHDIEFVTEIGISLLAQVRQLQALLVEKEEALKAVSLEKSKLENEAEGFHERLRSLDESEHRYKDENWNLETQIHEFIAASKEAASRETKLNHSLDVLQSEKSAAQKELDEIKLSHAKLTEDHASMIKHHDVELGSVKRSMAMAENERGALQRKVDDLIGQNQELAKAVASQRGRLEERAQARGLTEDDFETAPDDGTPEHSPPPSPIKGTPRHSLLESETLKSSLHHAHRMIQNLKGNIHREKTEKLELKRMLQDARDELETRRADGGLGSSNGKRTRKVESKEFKKPLKPGQLGGLRTSRSEVFLDDTNWEEHDSQQSPSHSGAVTAARAAASSTTGSSDHFETANEASSDAFETANERSTETEDFQTGVEEMSESDDLTETESGPTGTIRNRPAPLTLSKAGSRHSFQSTASTSGDEYSYEDLKTPTTQSQPQRLRLKVNRGANRRSRVASEEPQFQNSPASLANSSRDGTPQVQGQSLFAELGELGASDDESLQETPSRSPFLSQPVTPSSTRPGTAKGTPAANLPLPPMPKIPMVDSGMMTEPWEPRPSTPQTAVPAIAEAAIAGASVAETTNLMSYKRTSTGTQVYAQMSDAASQWQDDSNGHLMVETGSQGDSRPISSTYSDMSSQYDPEIMQENLAQFPSPPVSRAHTPMVNLSTPTPLTVSSILSEQVVPIGPVEQDEIESPVIPEQSIFPTSTTPISAVVPEHLAFSSIQTVDTEPIEPVSPRSPKRDGIILPKDESDEEKSIKNEPETPKPTFLGSVFGWNKNKSSTTPIIAEDDTRQSPSDSLVFVETPESQRPFKEISHNTNERAVVETIDESSQTALTSKQIGDMLRTRRQEAIIAEDGHKSGPYSPPRATNIPAALRVRKSQESIGSVGRARSKVADPDFANDTVVLKRPTSPGSVRKSSISSIHPPLPTDHKQVIAAAAQRTNSSSGGTGTIGTMGPPLLPASAYRNNPSFRPRTPSNQTPASPTSIRGPTPKTIQTSGIAEPYSPTVTTGRSRRSSLSSFASEVDTRFNMRGGVPMPQGIESGTDPRMINAITQTMIGEYLWKYTRKAGRGGLSENRHRRYFWVHPYTRTLYWSDRDPSQAGRAELKAKSVAIEAVRVVTDDNPMPPGLHRKSLIIMTPGRTVKFTATTGQRHETWFNALSYLLLRAGEKGTTDSTGAAGGALTHEDVDEFNPGHANTVRRAPASLSSYNSRTTRNDSPSGRTTRTSGNHAYLAQPSTSRAPMGTFSRLSSYLLPQAGSFSSRRSRQSISGAAVGNGSIYQASEVHDSAEDLREMIEKQDRESDKLENVRACCDGKHDVGHLHTHSTKSRHSHTIGPSPGSTQPKQQTRNTVTRRTD
ncbi:hypothetical protein B7494_g3180 [Chlorociboria aeruginascens]|nr:hypothetical protein B7494_g3180 [Chlorociboria aeruginascens]